MDTRLQWQTVLPLNTKNRKDICHRKKFINVPKVLYKKARVLIEGRSDSGTRTISEFVADAVRRRIEEIEKLARLKPLEPSPSKEQKRATSL